MDADSLGSAATVVALPQTPVTRVFLPETWGLSIPLICAPGSPCERGTNVTDAVQRGLSAVNEFLPQFAAGHAGRMEVYTYGPAGGEPHIVSYDFGVHEIDGADLTEWVAEGASIVISITRRRRVEPTVGASTSAARAPRSVGITAQVVPQASQTVPAASAESVTAPPTPTDGAQSGSESGPTHEEAQAARLLMQGLSNRDSRHAPSAPYRSVRGVVPRMRLAPGVDG